MPILGAGSFYPGHQEVALPGLLQNEHASAEEAILL